MRIKRTLPGWGYWGKWILLSFFGFTLASFLGMSLAWMVVGVDATGNEWTPKYFSMAYLDTMFSEDDDRWRTIKYSAYYAQGGELIYRIVTVAIGGTIQWMFLRKYTSKAWLWAIPVPLSEVIYFLSTSFKLPIGGGVWLIAFYAKDFGIFAAFYSLILGLPLVWYLRRTYRRLNT